MFWLSKTEMQKSCVFSRMFILPVIVGWIRFRMISRSYRCHFVSVNCILPEEQFHLEKINERINELVNEWKNENKLKDNEVFIMVRLFCWKNSIDKNNKPFQLFQEGWYYSTHSSIWWTWNKDHIFQPSVVSRRGKARRTITPCLAVKWNCVWNCVCH